jgi:hypothetical protein
MISWWYSLLFAIPAAILAFMGIASLFSSDASAASVDLTITDSASGQPLSGAIVTVGDQQATSDDKGIARIDRPDDPTTIVVQAVNYEPMHGTIDKNSKTDQAVALRSSTVSGVITDSATGAPVAGARITVMNSDGPTELTTTSGADGSFSITNVPSGASLQIDADGFTELNQPTNNSAQVNIALNAAPVATPTPTPTEAASTDQQGAGGTPQAEETPVDMANMPQVPDVTKGIYLSANGAADDSVVNSIIDLVNTTELNTVVLDIKEGYVWYDSDVSFFKDAGAVDPVYDADALIKKFHDNGIYVIGRLVVFNDPIVADAYPELAIPAVGGGLWKGADGNPWVNPFNQELWQANIDLAVEAAGRGFDEIQYDYIRFPSDGDLNSADFPADYNEMDGRVAAISGFLEDSLPQVHAAGAWQSADVFGIVAVYDDDQGIGQYLRDLVQYVDFVSPMVYPSHWTEGSLAVEGEPNDHPGDVITVSIGSALDKIDGEAGKLRPWLQDFSLGGMAAYGPDQVREQIDAAEAEGVEGWLLWNGGGGTDNSAALNPQE